MRAILRSTGTYSLLLVADLQHPPETIPAFLRALDDAETPFALGTRYGPGGGVDRDWPLYRRIISAGARSLARPLTSASDPMTGFFGLTKDLVRTLPHPTSLIPHSVHSRHADSTRKQTR